MYETDKRTKRIQLFIKTFSNIAIWRKSSTQFLLYLNSKKYSSKMKLCRLRIFRLSDRVCRHFVKENFIDLYAYLFCNIKNTLNYKFLPIKSRDKKLWCLKYKNNFITSKFSLWNIYKITIPYWKLYTFIFYILQTLKVLSPFKIRSQYKETRNVCEKY